MTKKEMSQNGKGSKRRPSFVSEEILLYNWKRIFHNGQAGSQKLGQSQQPPKKEKNE